MEHTMASLVETLAGLSNWRWIEITQGVILLGGLLLLLGSNRQATR